MFYSGFPYLVDGDQEKNRFGNQKRCVPSVSLESHEEEFTNQMVSAKR